MNPQQVGAKLQTLVENVVNRDKLIHNAVLGVAHGDSEFIWSGAAGYADQARRTLMQPETPFFLASVTKMYTAAAIMILQERGKLALGDRISKHLPSSLIQGIHRLKGTDYTHLLTIRHLVSHTSGLADYSLDRPKHGKSLFDRLFTEGDRAFTLEDVVRMVRDDLTPKFPPAVPDQNTGLHLRAKAHYSDTNYQLLGAIIESVTDRPLHAVFEEFFFRPLNLTQTYLRGYPSMNAPGEPASIFRKDRALHLDRAMKSVAAQGGLVSTVNDCLRFMKAFTQGELFARKDTFATMQQWNKIFFPFQYGYGLMRFQLPRLLSPFAPSPELVGHSGSTGSFLFFCKELNLYLAGTINQTERLRAPFALMLRAAEIVRGFASKRPERS
jgi:D-alanyl-D-alanine carboxypeptidase